MKQEDKKLLQCLCEMLPHGLFVAVKETDDDSTLVPLYDEDGNIDETNEPNIHSLVSCNCYGECDIDDYSTAYVSEIKPYLRPMESMTENEKKVYDKLRMNYYKLFSTESSSNLIDWLNANHLDYRGWIKEGRALEAPAGMYKQKQS